MSWPPLPFTCPHCGRRPSVDGGHARGCEFIAKARDRKAAGVRSSRIAKRAEPVDPFEELRAQLRGE